MTPLGELTVNDSASNAVYICECYIWSGKAAGRCGSCTQQPFAQLTACTTSAQLTAALIIASAAGIECTMELCMPQCQTCSSSDCNSMYSHRQMQCQSLDYLSVVIGQLRAYIYIWLLHPLEQL
jgi:hypothetical protein